MAHQPHHPPQPSSSPQPSRASESDRRQASKQNRPIHPASTGEAAAGRETTEPTALKPCPACEAPLSATEAQQRLQGEICVGCTVLPPAASEAGEVLFCSRSGKMLEAEDFFEGRAIRVGKRCFHLDMLRESRRRGLESGTFACDACGVAIPARRFVRGKAKVVDKVLLCHKCYGRDPDPAGNQRQADAGTEETPRSAESGSAPQEHTAMSVPALRAHEQPSAPARDDSSSGDGGIPVQPEVAQPAATTTAAGNAQAQSEQEHEAAQLQTDPLGLETAQTSAAATGDSTAPDSSASATSSSQRNGKRRPSGRSLKPSEGAASSTKDLRKRRPQIPHAKRRPQLSLPRRHTAAKLAARNDIQAHGAPERKSADATPASAPSMAAYTGHGPYVLVGGRETTAMLGVMVLLVLVLCGMLLFVFLHTQEGAGSRGTSVAEEETAAILAMNERLDRLVQQYGSVDQQLTELERRLEGGAGQQAAPAAEGRPAEFAEQDPRGLPWPQGTEGAPAPHEQGAPAERPGEADPAAPVVQAEGEEQQAGAEVSRENASTVENPRIVALSAEDASARLEAVLDVHRYAHYEAIPQLIERVENDSDEYVRAFAIKALASFRAVEALPTLETLANSAEHPVVQNAAADALAQLPRD